MWSLVQQKISLSDLNSDNSDVDPGYINNQKKKTKRAAVLEAVMSEKEGGRLEGKKKQSQLQVNETSNISTETVPVELQEKSHYNKWKPPFK